MADRYRSGWWLELKYHDEGWTQAEIAEACNVSPRTIRTYMDEHDIETRDVEGENHGLYGETRDEAVREKISETLEGREFDAESRAKMARSHTGLSIPEDVREQISESLEGLERPTDTRRRMSLSRRGEDNPNWRGGRIGPYGHEWAVARRKVRERDGVCQHCGHDGSARLLDVHHIIPVRVFKSAADASVPDAHQLENLVLLCRQCHIAAEHGDLSFESGLDRPQ